MVAILIISSVIVDEPVNSLIFQTYSYLDIFALGPVINFFSATLNSHHETSAVVLVA
nr:hypothetical protein [bacterium]